MGMATKGSHDGSSTYLLILSPPPLSRRPLMQQTGSHRLNLPGSWLVGATNRNDCVYSGPSGGIRHPSAAYPQRVGLLQRRRPSGQRHPHRPGRKL